MDKPPGPAQRSRRGLLAAALALGAVGVATRYALAPVVPELDARRRGAFVVLERGDATTLLRTLDVRLAPDPESAALDPLAPASFESAAAAQVLGGGPSDLVAFLDYRCTFCRRHGDALLAGARDGRYRLVVRDWPILGPASVLAARAALAAAAQGAYWPVHEALMRTGFVIDAALIEDVARRAALDVARLRADMRAPAVDRTLARNDALARAIGGVGTPLFVVDGVIIPGGYRPTTLLALAERHRPAE